MDDESHPERELIGLRVTDNPFGHSIDWMCDQDELDDPLFQEESDQERIEETETNYVTNLVPGVHPRRERDIARLVFEHPETKKLAESQDTIIIFDLNKQFCNHLVNDIAASLGYGFLHEKVPDQLADYQDPRWEAEKHRYHSFTEAVFGVQQLIWHVKDACGILEKVSRRVAENVCLGKDHTPPYVKDLYRHTGVTDTIENAYRLRQHVRNLSFVNGTDEVDDYYKYPKSSEFNTLQDKLIHQLGYILEFNSEDEEAHEKNNSGSSMRAHRAYVGRKPYKPHTLTDHQLVIVINRGVLKPDPKYKVLDITDKLHNKDGPITAHILAA